MQATSIFSLNETGSKKNQEDYIWPPPDFPQGSSNVFLVCDGVGGSENGEIASKIIAGSVGELLREHSTAITAQKALEIITIAKGKLLEYARNNSLGTDMATTICMLVLSPGKAFIGWCGDSRVYHIRKGRILFRTEDHSLVNNLIKLRTINYFQTS